MENAYAVSRFLLSGSGGQGVITMAILLAEAAVKYEGLVAVQSQSYGPEARGGATRSDVILSHKAIYYPKVEQPNILVALTDAACVKYLPLIRPGGLCIYDTELVHPGRKVEAQFKGLPLWGASSILPPVTGKAMTKQAGRPFDWTAWRCCEVTTTIMNRTTGTDIRPCGGRVSERTTRKTPSGWPMKGR